MFSRSMGIVLIVGAAAGCGGEDEFCDAASLAAALGAAQSGDTVQMGSCRIEGAFTVPAGVRLRGKEGSVIASSAGSAAITLSPGAGASCVSSLRIESAGSIAILARGAG